MQALTRFLRALPLLLISPVLIIVPLVAFALADLLHFLFRGSRPTPTTPTPCPRPRSASVVIPNWNGRDLLERYLPSVIEAMAGNSANEIIVVDNGSTDHSAELLRSKFPEVKVLALERNLGFGGGSNAGIRAASNEIVVLLNSDMRVAPDFLDPLLAGFTDDCVFAVSCQIFFSDPGKLRQETGLTQGWWANGALRVRHRIDDAIHYLYPCFYGGGGSCAFHRAKFLELGGFDHLLAPFYLEDTDLGYMAWKRGWKVLYQPRSIVWHEHRGTIGKKFSDAYIQGVLKKNFLLFVWKNIHDWKWFGAHFLHAWADGAIGAFFGDSPERSSLQGLWRAFLQLPGALRSRWRARSLSRIDDTEAFRRPLGGYFRDRFADIPGRPQPLRVLFLSPYPIYPPVHGGAVFMSQTLKQLVKLCEVHLIALLDFPHEKEAHDALARQCGSAEFFVRLTGKSKMFGAIEPHAVNEFANADLEWLIHRQIYLRQIDVIQLEYTNMGQYAGAYNRLACILFEHDIYFQSIARALHQPGYFSRKATAWFEYLRALRYELRLLPKLDRVQVCSRENMDYLLGFLPELASRIDDNLRAGIEVDRYRFEPSGREPGTMLFLGSFRHVPNQEALDWFVRRVLPLVLSRWPKARLVIAGSDPPPRHSLPVAPESVEIRGFVEDVQEALRRYAVFVCPILSGSGIRVKLLEAFSSGIPVVSTRLGAEGLATKDGEICRLADTPRDFAECLIDLLENPEKGAEMARRARREMQESRDMPAITRRLVASYEDAISRKRTAISRSS